jgi:hypothetical protein
LSPAQEKSLALLGTLRQGREERLRAYAMEGDDIVVTLVRHATEKGAPWGFQFDHKTLQLRHVEKMSIASRNAVLAACIGLVLLKVNGRPVRSLDCVRRLTSICTSITLRFNPADPIAISARRHTKLDAEAPALQVPVHEETVVNLVRDPSQQGRVIIPGCDHT